MVVVIQPIKESTMRKLTVAVLLFGVVCSALHDAYYYDEGENFEEHGQSVYSSKLDSDDFVQFTEEFEDDDFGEIEAIQGHVKYQDVARDTLLKLALKLRKGKNVTNAFLKVIDNFEKEIAEFHAALRRRTVKPETISNIEEFIKEGAKNRTGNTKILRKLTSQGLFVAERLGENSKRSKRDFLSYGAAEFLNTIKEEIGEKLFEEYLSISGLVTLMFVIDDTGSMSEEIKAAISISEQIVKAKRDYDVDYILSPFNDPGKLFLQNFQFMFCFFYGFSFSWALFHKVCRSGVAGGGGGEWLASASKSNFGICLKGSASNSVSNAIRL